MRHLLLALALWLSFTTPAWAVPAFSVTAAVTWAFSGASNSATRTIPTADSVYLACTWVDATGDSLASTIAAASPTDSFQTIANESEKTYFAVYIAAPSGSQTVAVSGADAGDETSCGFRGLDDIDTTTPWDGEVSDTTTPASISVVTTADGLAVGGVFAEDTTAATSDTQVFEGAETASGFVINVASTPGTGGTVSIDWTNIFNSSVAANMRAAAAPPGGAPPTRTLLGVGQ